MAPKSLAELRADVAHIREGDFRFDTPPQELVADALDGILDHVETLGAVQALADKPKAKKEPTKKAES